MPVAALLAVLVALSVEGRGNCPPAVEVRARLSGLVEQNTAPVRVRLTEEKNGLLLTLLDEHGRRVADRRLSAQDSAAPPAPQSDRCAALAAGAAIVIATWVGELRRLGDLGLAASIPGPPPALALPAAPPRPHWHLDIGAAFAPQFDGTRSWAPGLRVWAGAGRPARRLEWLAGAVVGGEHAVPLGRGEARFARWVGTAGVRINTLPLRGLVHLAASAQACGGIIRVRGDGLAESRGETAPEVGSTLGLEALWATGTWRPWLGLGAAWWPIERGFHAGGSGALARPEVVQWWAGLGLQWRVR